MIFNPARHEYSDNGIIIPSVTQILKAAGLIDDTWYSREATERGSAVHELCERYAHGTRADGLGRPLASLEYVNAFARWMDDTGAYAYMTECMVDGLANGKRYAGRFDILALINGKRVLVDIKTGGMAKWHPVQLAAYSLARLDTGERVNPDRCAVLYLNADGSYKEDRITPAQMLKGIERFKECL